MSNIKFSSKLSKKSVSNKMSGAVDVSGDESTEKEVYLTPFQIMNIYDLPDIYTHVCFNVYKDVLMFQPDVLTSILEQMSFINVKSEEIVTEFCNILQSKNIKDFETFIERSAKNPRISRKSSIFRYDSKSILSAFVNHDTNQQATYFMRYVLHSQYLPDMKSFLEQYKNADFALRDALVPKVIYSWYNVE